MVTKLLFAALAQIWHPPFHKLSEKEVSYLVRGIAEVYGQDEEEFRRAQQQLTTTSSGGAQVRQLTGTAGSWQFGG